MKLRTPPAKLLPHVLLALAIVFSLSSCAYTIGNNYTATSIQRGHQLRNPGSYFAVVFSARDSATLTSASFYITSQPQPQPNCFNATLQAADSSMAPSGPGLAVGSFCTASTGWYTASFSPGYALSAGNNYTLAVISNGTGGIGDQNSIAPYFLAGTGQPDPRWPIDLSNGWFNYWYFNGNQLALENQSLLFVLSMSNFEQQGIPYTGFGGQGINGANWQSQVFSLNSSSKITGLGAFLSKNSSGTPPDSLRAQINWANGTVLVQPFVLVANTSVTTTPAWYSASIPSSPAILPAGTFQLVLHSEQRASLGSTAFNWSWLQAPAFPGAGYNGTDSYSQYSTDGGATWTRAAYADFSFYLAASPYSPPSISLVSPAAGSTLYSPNVGLSCTASAPTGISSVTLYDNFSGTFAADGTNSSPVNNSVVNFNRTLPLGSYQWSCSVTDSIGQTLQAPAITFSVASLPCANLTSSLTLTSSVTSPASCFSLEAPNIVLDCAGNSITFATGGQGDYGVTLDAFNDSLRNCSIIESPSASPAFPHSGVILTANANYSQVLNTAVKISAGNSVGVSLSCSSCNVTNATINDSAAASPGIAVYGQNDLISRSSITVSAPSTLPSQASPGSAGILLLPGTAFNSINATSISSTNGSIGLLANGALYSSVVLSSISGQGSLQSVWLSGGAFNTLLQDTFATLTSNSSNFLNLSASAVTSAASLLSSSNASLYSDYLGAFSSNSSSNTVLSQSTVAGAASLNATSYSFFNGSIFGQGLNNFASGFNLFTGNTFNAPYVSAGRASTNIFSANKFVSFQANDEDYGVFANNSVNAAQTPYAALSLGSMYSGHASYWSVYGNTLTSDTLPLSLASPLGAGQPSAFNVFTNNSLVLSGHSPLEGVLLSYAKQNSLVNNALSCTSSCSISSVPSVVSTNSSTDNLLLNDSFNFANAFAFSGTPAAPSNYTVAWFAAASIANHSAPVQGAVLHLSSQAAGEQLALAQYFEGDFKDSSGNGFEPSNAASIPSNAFSSSCQVGSCYDLSIGSPLSFTSPVAPTPPYSVCAWAQPGQVSSSGTYYLASNALPPNQIGFSLSLSTGGSTMSWAFDATSPSGTVGTATYSVQASSAWTQVCASWDGSSGAKIYVNGVPAPLGPVPILTVGSPSQPSNLVIGGAPSGGGSAWNGKLDEVRIWNRTLSAAEVSQLYLAESSGLPPASIPLAKEFSASTGPAGLTQFFPVEQFEGNQTANKSYNSYLVEASKQGPDGKVAKIRSYVNFSAPTLFLADFSNVSCGSTLLSSSTLTTDIASSGSCLTISAPNTVLDCAGHSITFASGAGSNRQGLYGISVEAPGAVLKNCNVVEAPASSNGSGGAVAIGFSQAASGSSLYSSNASTNSPNSVGVLFSCASCGVYSSTADSSGIGSSAVSLSGNGISVYSNSLIAQAGAVAVSSSQTNALNLTSNSISGGAALSNGTSTMLYGNSIDFLQLFGQQGLYASANTIDATASFSPAVYLDNVSGSTIRDGAVASGEFALQLSPSSPLAADSGNLLANLSITSPSGGVFAFRSPNNTLANSSIACPPNGCLLGYSAAYLGANSSLNFVNSTISSNNNPGPIPLTYSSLLQGLGQTGGSVKLKTAAVLYNFQNNQSQPFSPEDVRRLLFTGTDSVNAFYQENSYGKVQLVGRDRPDGDVYGWITVNGQNYTGGCPTIGGVVAQAEQNGLNLTGYDLIQFYTFSDQHCADWGVEPGGYSSMTLSLSELNRIGIGHYFFALVAAHEIGHNLGLPHSYYLTCSENGRYVPISDFHNCTTLEYGDPFDPMSALSYSHFNNFFKGSLGWFSDSNTFTATASGIYYLKPIEIPSNGTLALRIPTPYLYGGLAAAKHSINALMPPTTFVTGINANLPLYYYLEFRQPYGFDAKYINPTFNPTQGVFVRLAPDYRLTTFADPYQTVPLLIGTNSSFAPISTNSSGSDWANNAFNSPLRVGSTFTDSRSGISVTTLSVNSTDAVVQISFSSAPTPTPIPPFPSPTPIPPFPPTPILPSNPTDLLSSIQYGSGANNVSTYWYLDGLATDNGTAISGITVNVTNSSSTTPMLALLTDSNGRIPTTLLEAFSGNSTQNFSYTPHLLTATSPSGANGFLQVFLNQSTFATLDFGNSFCGLVTQSTTLNNDVHSAGSCFTIASSNIVLDCTGHTVYYASGGFAAASFLSNADDAVYANGVSNLTVRNCKFVQSNPSSQAAGAIVANGVSGLNVYGNTISTAGSWADQSQPLTGSPGIAVYGSSANVSIYNDVVRTNGAGSHAIVLNGASNATVDSNSVSTQGTTAIGIAAAQSSGLIISRNNVQAAGTLSPGIYLYAAGSNDTVQSNTIATSAIGSDGIELLNSAAPLRIASNSVTALGASGATQALSIFSSSAASVSSNSLSSQGAGSYAASLLSSSSNSFQSNFIGVTDPSSTSLSLSSCSANTFSGDTLSAGNGFGLQLSSSVSNEFDGISTPSQIYSTMNSGSNTLFDSTFNSSLLQYGAGANNLTVSWSGRVLVTDSSRTPLPGAQVNATDPTGRLLLLGATDSNGLTPFSRFTSFVGNNSASSQYNPYSLGVFEPGFDRATVSASVNSPVSTIPVALNSSVRLPSSVPTLLVSIPSLGEIVEFNSTGAATWTFTGSQAALSSPSDAVAAGANVLVADSGNSRVVEFNSNESVVWQYGVLASPGSGFNLLNAPQSAMRVSSGATIIADSGNQRVIEVDSRNNILWQLPTSPKTPVLAVATGSEVLISFSDGSLEQANPATGAADWQYAASSSYVRAYPLSDGNVLVVDNANQRVLEAVPVKPGSASLLWSKQIPAVRDAVQLSDGSIAIVNDSSLMMLSPDRQALSTIASLPGVPSSVRPGQGPFVQPVSQASRGALTYFVADPGNRRVLELDSQMQSVLWQYSSGLQNPLSVSSGFNGQRVFIADSAARQVVGVFYGNGTVFWHHSVTGVPSDIEWVGGEAVLVADSASDTVTDYNFTTDTAIWSFGQGVLNTPLGASPTSSGGMLVADSGNNRVLLVFPNGNYSVLTPSNLSFVQPSRAVAQPNGDILVADTGNKRVVQLAPDGTVLAVIGAGRFAALSSVYPLANDAFLLADQGLQVVAAMNFSGTVLSRYTQLSSPTDIVVGFDQSYYKSFFSTQMQPTESIVLTKSVPQTFSLILAKGSVGTVSSVPFSNGVWTPFAAVGGPQVSSCAAGDLFCCATGWCNQTALSQYTGTLVAKALAVANATAFKRGSPQPMQTLTSLPFTYTAVAQLAEGVSLSAAGYGCSTNCSAPGIFLLQAKITNSSSAVLSASPLTLYSERSIDPSLQQPLQLLGFIYANGSSIVSSSQPNLLTGNQLANQRVQTSSCSWQKPACIATTGPCCGTSASGACTALSYNFTPSPAVLTPSGQNCPPISVPVKCQYTTYCGEVQNTPFCTPVPATAYYYVANDTVYRVLQDGLSATCDPIPAPVPPSFSVDSLWSQLDSYVVPPICVTNSTGQCPPTPYNASIDSSLLNAITISKPS